MEKKRSLKQEKIVDLVKLISEYFNVTKKNLETISERIKKYNGHIRVFVHPIENPNELVGHANLLSVFARSLSQHVPRNDRTGDTSVTFVLASKKFVTKYQNDLEKFLGVDLAKNGIIILPTENHRSEISFQLTKIFESFFKVEFSELDPKSEFYDRQRSVHIFTFLLKLLGVKSVTASGGQVDVGYDVSNKPYLDRCLGDFVDILRIYEFKVDIAGSALYNSGVDRNKLAEIGVELKQTGKKL